MIQMPEEFLKKVSLLSPPVTLVVNDGTRPSPEKYVSKLLPHLPENMRILFATGTHRPVTPEEEVSILGQLANRKTPSMSNTSDEASHVFIGETSRGTPVEIHRWLLEGSVLAVNTLEPHYFAGYTGGRKSFLPGCSSMKTTVANHYLACLDGCLPGRLIHNPVHLDMVEGVEMLCTRIDALMVNGIGGSSRCFCGTPSSSFSRASSAAAERFGVPVSRRFNSLELEPGGNLGINLYQSMKAVFMWAPAVVDGGSLILSAECPEGLGAPQMERLLMDSAAGLPVPSSAAEYRLGDHAALRLNRIRSRINLCFRTGIDMKRFGFTDPPATIEHRQTDGGFTFPILQEDHA